MDSNNFVVAIKHNPYSGNFFIDFSDERGVIISCKVTEGVATGLAKHLGLKITI